MNKKKRHLRFPVLYGLLLLLMGGSIAAAAAILPQLFRQRQNDFIPAAAEIGIQENDEAPQATDEGSFELTEQPDKSGYIVDKKVQITNHQTDEYIKAALIPQWVDAQGRLYAGTAFSDFGKAQPPDPVTNTQQVVNGEGRVLLTYYLSPDWSKYWTYNSSNGFYYYRTPLKKGAVTEPLILQAGIPADVDEQTQVYTLQIDVLTEGIQTVASATEIRSFME